MGFCLESVGKGNVETLKKDRRAYRMWWCTILGTRGRSEPLPSVPGHKLMWLLFFNIKKIFAYRIITNTARKLFSVIQIFKLLYVLIFWATISRLACRVKSVCVFWCGYLQRVCVSCAFSLERVPCEDPASHHFLGDRELCIYSCLWCRS